MTTTAALVRREFLEPAMDARALNQEQAVILINEETPEADSLIEHLAALHRTGDETHGLGSLRHGSEKDDGVRAIATVALEIVLDRARVGESQLFRFLGDRE